MLGFIKSFTPLLKKYTIESFLVATALVICCISIGLIIYNYQANEEEMQTEIETTSQKSPIINSKIMIEVNGAVKKAGVYELNTESRLKDAISLAQGLSPEADATFFARNFNMARILADQEKIYIPSISEVLSGLFVENSQTLNYLTPESTINEVKVNINKAAPDELDTLPGIGQVTAQKIIQNRPYSTIDELLTKKIVRKNIFEQIKNLVEL